MLHVPSAITCSDLTVPGLPGFEEASKYGVGRANVNHLGALLQRANQEQARAGFVLVFLFSNLLLRLIDLHTEPTRSLSSSQSASLPRKSTLAWHCLQGLQLLQPNKGSLPQPKLTFSLFFCSIGHWPLRQSFCSKKSIDLHLAPCTSRCHGGVHCSLIDIDRKLSGSGYTFTSLESSTLQFCGEYQKRKASCPIPSLQLLCLELGGWEDPARVPRLTDNN